jgi:hypothetical protein
MAPEDRTLELWSNSKILGYLEIVREPFFWGSRTQLALTNGSATNTTNWISIDNRQDTTRDAYVDVSSSSIDGELPTPVEIQLRNDDLSGRLYERFYIGVNAKSDPTNTLPVFEGEDIAGASITTPTFADSSGGQYASISVTGGNNKVYPRWSIPQAMADAFAGNFVRVLMKILVLNEDWVIKAQVLDTYNLVNLYEEQPRTIIDNFDDGEIIDLGVIPIPPVAYTSDLAAQTLRLEMYHTGGVSDVGQIDIDYVFLMPTDAGRTIIQRGMQIPSTNEMIFDDIERVWVSNEGGYRHPIYSPRGPGVMVFPGFDNRIFILHDRSSISDPADSKSMKLFYRPRRLTI